jgi:hypothetical protein
MPYVTTNHPIILSDLSYRGSIHCAIGLCSTLIFSISLYNYLVARMVIMHSTSGRVFMLSLDLCAFSCELFILSLITFSYGFTISCVQIHVFSSHSLAHSSSRLLMLVTEVMVCLSLCSFSSVGVPSVVHTSNSPILLWNP